VGGSVAANVIQPPYSAFAPENFTTFAHFSVSAVCSFQNAAGVPAMG